MKALSMWPISMSRLRREGHVKRMSERCKKSMFHQQWINVCVHVNVSAHVHNQRLVSSVSNVCEMVQFLWNMFYYNDINSVIYL